MSNKIRISVSDLRAQAAELSAIASDFENQYRTAFNAMQNMKSAMSYSMSVNMDMKTSSVLSAFTSINQTLQQGVVIADFSADSFEQADSTLAKIANFGNQDSKANNKVTLAHSSDLKTVADLYDYLDEQQSFLSGNSKLAIDALKIAAKARFKAITKGTPLEGIETAQKITKKIIKGDFSGAADDFCSSVFSSFDIKNGGIQWGGLKVQAVTKSIKLATNPNGYINQNDEKYMNMAYDYLKGGDVAGTLSSLSGGLVQTVGKGSVDVTCQLASGLVDSYTSKIFGISLSDCNKLIYDAIGFSPGSIFNSATKAISGGVDVAVDTGIKVSSAIGKGIGKGINSVGSFIGGLF